MLKFNGNLTDKQWSCVLRLHEILKEMAQNDMQMIFEKDTECLYFLNTKGVRFTDTLSNTPGSIVLIGGFSMKEVGFPGFEEVYIVDTKKFNIKKTDSEGFYFVIEDKKEK